MPTTIEALLLVILFVGPGFLCARFVRAEIPSSLTGEKNSIILSMIFSTLIHTILLPYTIFILPNIQEFIASLNQPNNRNNLSFDWLVFCWIVIVLFVAPLVTALALSWLWRFEPMQPFLSKLGMSVTQTIPTAWDWVFLSQTDGCWIVAEMEDGSVVGGEYGAGSFASLSPHRSDLFLEKEYELDENHNFLAVLPDTVGVWINAEKVKHIHLYRVSENEG